MSSILIILREITKPIRVFILFLFFIFLLLLLLINSMPDYTKFKCRVVMLQYSKLKTKSVM